MASGELGASSFEFYEGIRILIPGAACVALYAGVVSTFGLDAPMPSESIVGSAIAALMAGLFLYFIDFPSHSVAYRTGLPDKQIDEWELPSSLNRINFYFILLDADIPSGIKNRALYMGSMFRIGFELIYLFFAVAAGVVSVALLVPGAGAQRSSDAVEPVLWAAAVLFVGLFLLAVVFELLRVRRYNKNAPVDRRKKPFSIFSQLSMADFALLMLSLLLVAAYQFSGVEAFGGAAIATPVAMWAVRYQRGYMGQAGKSRETCSRAVAVLWFAWAGVTLCVLGALNLPSTSSLGLKEAVGWLGSALFAGSLMVSRGPEKKLLGSYSTQRTWLSLNSTPLREKYLDPTS